MSTKFFALAALVLLPLSTLAQEQERDMHYFQDCPSTAYDICVNYHEALRSHVNKPDFFKVRLKLQDEAARESAANAGKKSFPLAKTAAAYEKALIAEGVMNDDAREISRIRFSKKLAEAKRFPRESLAFNRAIGLAAAEQAEAMKTADGAFLWNEGVQGENKAEQIKSRINVLRSNAKIVDNETARHQMLQRADRLQKILNGGIASNGSTASSKANR